MGAGQGSHRQARQQALDEGPLGAQPHVDAKPPLALIEKSDRRGIHGTERGDLNGTLVGLGCRGLALSLCGKNGLGGVIDRFSRFAGRQLDRRADVLG